MKHESMLDGVELCEQSLDKTWKHVGLDGVGLFEHSLDETWKHVNLIIWMKLYYVNWNIYIYMDENDEFDVYETFHMDEVQKHGMMWP